MVNCEYTKPSRGPPASLTEDCSSVQWWYYHKDHENPLSMPNGWYKYDARTNRRMERLFHSNAVKPTIGPSCNLNFNFMLERNEKTGKRRAIYRYVPNDANTPNSLGGKLARTESKFFKGDTLDTVSTMAVLEGKNNRLLDKKLQYEVAEEQSALPHCVCNWKNCRVYQKAYRKSDHPFLDGVATMEFTKGEMASVSLKASVDRSLKVPKKIRQDWQATEGGDETIQYTIARHHFTEAHIRRYIKADDYKWKSLFTLEQAQRLLFELHPKNSITMASSSLRSSNGGVIQTYYLQCPTVSKEFVREQYLQMMAQLEKERTVGATSEDTKPTHEQFEEPSENTPAPPKVPARASVLCKGGPMEPLLLDRPCLEEEDEKEEVTICFGGCICRLIHGVYQKARNALSGGHEVEIQKHVLGEGGQEDNKDSISVATESTSDTSSIASGE